MQTAQLIVWEPTDQWVVHFRRLMAPLDGRIRRCSTELLCDEMLAKWPASVVAVSISTEQFGERLVDQLFQIITDLLRFKLLGFFNHLEVGRFVFIRIAFQLALVVRGAVDQS